MSRILLVEPSFPIPAKSRNHKNFLPVGLLKIATYLRDHGHQVKLIRGICEDPREPEEINRFDPEQVWVTSLFTYWAKYVRQAVQFYRNVFPSAHIKVGGIYASLLPPEEVKEYTGCHDVYQGVIPEVEEYARSHAPAYELLGDSNPHPIDFQIVHASRGCPRRCPFCGTWQIEPSFTPKQSIKSEIRLPGVVFYDNNFLMNPYVESILDELIGLRRERKVKWVESQSGLDGRVLLEKPHLASMIKQAGFRYPRIAWDWGYDQRGYIERQIQVLLGAGYKSRDVFVFMLYNHEIPFEEMERKRIKCWEWQVQIADCRFRPLNQLVDNYNPLVIGQTSEDYFISERWNDALVKQFRRNVRRQNICVRMGHPIYSSAAEQMRLDREVLKQFRKIESLEEKMALLKASGADWWVPQQVSYPG
ncbi:MAG: cobalamin-dependent protein [Candidatus Bathyarchaeia archaeon]